MHHPLTRAARRAQRYRLIKKRLRIVKYAWAWSLRVGSPYLRYQRERGRLAKYNLQHDCGMCKGEKYRNRRGANRGVKKVYSTW